MDGCLSDFEIYARFSKVGRFFYRWLDESQKQVLDNLSNVLEK